MIGTATIRDFLHELSAREPTPGGGAAGALHAAQAAALIGMVARYSTGAKYAAHAQDCAEIQARADAHRDCSLRLADADAAAFQGVIGAYQLPKASPEEAAARSRAIQDALVAAADPPRSLVGVARGVVTLGERLADFANPNVISDVAAAAEAARAAAATARVNLDINAAGITDPVQKASLEAAVADSEETILAAEALSARVRKLILA